MTGNEILKSYSEGGVMNPTSHLVASLVNKRWGYIEAERELPDGTYRDVLFLLNDIGRRGLTDLGDKEYVL